MIQKKENMDLANIQQAVSTIKTAILQSQARATQAVNQEQLALYFGIGRYVGTEHAKAIKEADITLEEYLNIN